MLIFLSGILKFAFAFIVMLPMGKDLVVRVKTKKIKLFFEYGFEYQF